MNARFWRMLGLARCTGSPPGPVSLLSSRAGTSCAWFARFAEIGGSARLPPKPGLGAAERLCWHKAIGGWPRPRQARRGMAYEPFGAGSGWLELATGEARSSECHETVTKAIPPLSW